MCEGVFKTVNVEMENMKHFGVGVYKDQFKEK